MKIKIMVVCILVTLMFSSCTESQKQKYVINDQKTSKTRLDDNPNKNKIETLVNGGEMYGQVYEKIIDIVSVVPIKDSNDLLSIWVFINNSSKLIEFDNIDPVSGFKIDQLIRLGNGKIGLMLKLYSEGETNSQDGETGPPWWYDHTCIIIKYENDNIDVAFNGVKMPYNQENNYYIEYDKDFKVSFLDRATGFFVKYTNYSKYSEEIKKGIVQANAQKNYPVSRNYFNIRVSDEDLDGVDEIECCKYIPGFFQNHTLGVIHYYFRFVDGEYKLYEEAVSRDGNSGLNIVKQLLVK